jgi:2-dehydropantoate 2-reductase
VHHLTTHNRLVFGELDGSVTERVQALRDAFGNSPLQVEAADNVLMQMWEKLVGLGTLAAATVLMRANVGEIVRAPEGQVWLQRLLERGIAAAAAHGHPPRPATIEAVYRASLRDANSLLTASMLRDLEGGSRIEADHILGHLLAAVRRAGQPDELHEAAYLHAKAYENRRAARRLPG